MTMTSVSVIMAVLVINLYNRGSKASHAPRWVKLLFLEGVSRLLRMKHDIDKMTNSIRLVNLLLVQCHQLVDDYVFDANLRLSLYM